MGKMSCVVVNQILHAQNMFGFKKTEFLNFEQNRFCKSHLDCVVYPVEALLRE